MGCLGGRWLAGSLAEDGESLEPAAFVAYSMIWSARPSTDGGIVRPRACAVLRLITNSNVVGCSIGRSAGLAPFRILSTMPSAGRPAPVPAHRTRARHPGRSPATDRWLVDALAAADR